MMHEKIHGLIKLFHLCSDLQRRFIPVLHVAIKTKVKIYMNVIAIIKSQANT